MSRLSGYNAQMPWNPSSIALGAEARTQIDIPGAQMGDFVFISSDVDLGEGNLYAQVWQPGIVEIVYINMAEDPGDLPPMTLRLKVVPYDAI